MDVREMEWGGMYWIYLAKDRDQLRVLVSTEINFQVL
jgi:hypothetical protein